MPDRKLLIAAGLVACALATLAVPLGSAQELTAAQKQELAVREACKVKICAAIRNRKRGPDIACSLVRSWPKEQVEQIVSKAKIPWPWGDVRCTGEVKLERERLIKMMTEPRYETEFDTHKMACQIDRETEKADITVEFTPKVVFENGKAVKASMKWGKVEGPTAVRGALWTATATDNAVNVLQGTLVQYINDFIDVKCEELKSQWQDK